MVLPTRKKTMTCTKDYCDYDGAMRIKNNVETYWRDRGYRVEVKLVEMGFVPAMRSKRWDTRCPDLVNGFPRPECKIDAANENRPIREQASALA